MYGESAPGEASLGESYTGPAYIIAEVALATKTLVFVVELDMLSRTTIDDEGGSP